ncbi:MAG: ComF family protein [Polyangiaceae bacterium]
MPIADPAPESPTRPDIAEARLLRTGAPRAFFVRRASFLGWRAFFVRRAARLLRTARPTPWGGVPAAARAFLVAAGGFVAAADEWITAGRASIAEAGGWVAAARASIGAACGWIAAGRASIGAAGGWIAAARRLLDLVLALVGWIVAPDRCAGCDGALEGGASFCPPCAESVARDGSGTHLAASTHAEVVAYAEYGGAVAAAVRRFKYGGRADLARPLGAMLVKAARAAGVSGDVVVPVPLHGRKLRARGYNQAALLAKVLGRGLGARVAAGALSRTRATVAQASLDRSERLRNLDGAFRANAARLFRGKTVLLVDDVTTTGATLAACSAALLDAGAAQVVAVVLARVHDEPPHASRARSTPTR